MYIELTPREAVASKNNIGHSNITKPCGIWVTQMKGQIIQA